MNAGPTSSAVPGENATRPRMRRGASRDQIGRREESHERRRGRVHAEGGYFADSLIGYSQVNEDRSVMDVATDMDRMIERRAPREPDELRGQSNQRAGEGFLHGGEGLR